jgi:hypothetical protein
MNDLKKKTEDQIGKMQALLYLCGQYDLLEHRDRWSNIRYYSPKINKIADNVEIHHTCGCCSDAPLIARPYVVVNGINLYSDPPKFGIGEGLYGGGDRPDSHWQEQFKDFNPIITEIIQKYFDDNKPVEDDDE